MKKIFILLCGCVALLILFAAPWLWLDNGEDLIEREFRPRSVGEGIDEAFFKRSKDGCTCDGSCINVRWAPFGAVVDACSYDYYYVTFWGQKWYRSGK